MKNQKPIFAIDIGTTKMCLGVLDYKENSPRIRTYSIPSAGIRQGMLFNFNQALDSLKKLIEQAESELNIDISSVCVGVAGDHLIGKHIKSDIVVDGVIDSELLKKDLKKTEETNQIEHLEILHCIPISYKIDQRPNIDNPLGMSGYSLSINYFLVYADKAYLKDVIRLCNQNGVRVDSIYAEAVASASVILDDQAKENGAVVIDIGGGSSDCLVFQKGHPTDIFTVNIAGMLITNDLAIGLNLDYKEAERIKKCFDLTVGEQDKVETAICRGKECSISKGCVQKILRPRVKELSFFIAKHVLKYKGKLKGGLILTGGSSNIEGLDIYMSEMLKIPVQRIEHTISLKETLRFSSIYATVLGLINLELNKRRESSRKQIKSKYISSFVNWIKELME